MVVVIRCSVHIGPSKVTYTQTASQGVQGDNSGTEYLWNLLLMIVPIFVMIIVGIGALVVVIVYVLIHMKKLGWKYLVGQWRLLLFLAFYIYIYVFVFAFQIELIVQKDDQYDAYERYIECAIVQEVLGITCSLEQNVSYPLWFIVVFNASAQGVFAFIIFGTTAQVYKVIFFSFFLFSFFRITCFSFLIIRLGSICSPVTSSSSALAPVELRSD